MTKEERQERLTEIRLTVAKAADEMHGSGDPYAAVNRLAEALEQLLAYLERQDYLDRQQGE